MIKKLLSIFIFISLSSVASSFSFKQTQKDWFSHFKDMKSEGAKIGYFMYSEDKAEIFNMAEQFINQNHIEDYVILLERNFEMNIFEIYMKK